MCARPLPSAFVLAILSTAAISRGQTTPYHYFHTDQTFANTSLPGDKGSAIVGFDSQDPDTLAFLNPTNTSLTFSTNSSWQNDMWVYNNSVVSFTGGSSLPPTSTGGSIKSTLNAFDTSTIHLNDASSILTLNTYNNSQLFMDGGTLGKDTGQINNFGLYAHDSSTLHVSSGTVTQLFAVDSSTILLTGGSIAGTCSVQGNASSLSVANAFVGDASVSQGAALSITSGSFTYVTVSDTSTAQINNATIASNLLANNGSLTFNSGSAGSMTANNSGAATLAGASILGDVLANVSGTVNLNSGSVSGNLTATAGGIINLNNVAVAGNATLSGGTLNLNAGSIAGSLILTGTGTLNWTNTSLAGSLIAQGSSAYTLTHDVTSLQLSNNALITLTSSTISGSVATADSSSLTVTSGSIAPATIHNFSRITLSAGQAHSLDAYDSSDLFIHSPSQITGDISLHNHSTAYIDGGTITGNLVANDQSTLNLTGSTISGSLHSLSTEPITIDGAHITGGLDADGASNVTLATGSISGPVNVHNNASFNWTGGTLSPGSSGAYVRDNAFFSITGINLQSTLLNPNASGFSEYSLTGYSGDGTPIPAGLDIFVQNNNRAGFLLQPATQQWKPDATTGSWSDPNKWLPHLVPNGVGAIVSFGSADFTSSNPVTVSFDGNHTVGQLTFGAGGAGNNFTLSAGSGGILTLDNAGNGVFLNVLNANHTIALPIIANDNVTAFLQDYYNLDDKSDVSLKLLGGISFAPGKTLTVIGPGSLSSGAIRSGSLNLINSSLHILPSYTHLVISTLNSLAISSTSTLDLDDTALIVQDPTPSAPDTTLDFYRSLLHSAYNDGSWTGPGITASHSLPYPNHAPAYVDAASLNINSFDGIPLTNPAIILRSVLIGDANFDGRVNADDYALLDRSFAKHTPDAHWTEGDFNYDGIINSDDYLLIDSSYAYVQGLPFSPEFLSQRESQFGEAYVQSLIASVPEPTSLLSFLIAIPLLSRRRS